MRLYVHKFYIMMMMYSYILLGEYVIKDQKTSHHASQAPGIIPLTPRAPRSISHHLAVMLDTSTSRVTPMACRGTPRSISSDAHPPLISVRGSRVHRSDGTSSILDPCPEGSWPSRHLYASADPLERGADDSDLPLEMLFQLSSIRFAPRRTGLQHGKQALTTPRHSSACVQMLAGTSVPVTGSRSAWVVPARSLYTHTGRLRRAPWRDRAA